MARSVMAGVLIGRDDGELSASEARTSSPPSATSTGGDAWFRTRERRWVIGTRDKARAMVDEFAAAGAERLMLQDFVPRDLEMIDLMAEMLF